MALDFKSFSHLLSLFSVLYSKTTSYLSNGPLSALQLFVERFHIAKAKLDETEDSVSKLSKTMENESENTPERPEIRVPPRRGLIKNKIFAGLVKKVKAAVMLFGQGKKKEEAGTASSTTPIQNAYTSEGHSDS
ncbi:hypothetical protein WN943_018515 [Citrus x changshan-huyou]